MVVNLAKKKEAIMGMLSELAAEIDKVESGLKYGAECKDLALFVSEETKTAIVAESMYYNAGNPLELTWSMEKAEPCMWLYGLPMRVVPAMGEPWMICKTLKVGESEVKQ